MTRLALCFQEMPERHAELAWRFGEPDECQEDAAEPEGRGSRWVLASPLPPEAGAAEHLSWASDCLRPHEAFVGELISLGAKVVLRWEHREDAPGVAFQINARLLLPMAHAGVRIEFRAGWGQ